MPAHGVHSVPIGDQLVVGAALGHVLHMIQCNEWDKLSIAFTIESKYFLFVVSINVWDSGMWYMDLTYRHLLPGGL